jgi:hypothetical protein
VTLSPSRRNLLRSLGAVTVAGVTGCSAPVVTGDRGLVLGELSVRNAHPDEHTVRVELERDGELVHETTVTVGGDGDVERIGVSWPSTPAVYTLQYVVFGPDEEPDIRTRTLTADDVHTEGRCAVAVITIGFPDDSHPYVTVGTPDSLSGNCPG